jgi:hypothetical protein
MAKMGRPPEIPNRVTLYVYVTAQEQRRIARAARRAHLSASAWVRTVARAALDADAPETSHS